MFDKIIKENQFKTKCVIALYLLIFVFIGLLVDIVRINAQSLSGGFYSLLTLQQIPLVTLL
ncbi:MAG: heat-shock protein HtpX, partial [Helicobacter sp.]|nr:heat-shock protein HtpX [Helicobacter sp.]